MSGNPDHIEALVGLGDVLVALGEFEAAAVRYESALESVPMQAEVVERLASALARQGRATAAIPHLERIAAAEPAPQILNHLGACCAETGRLSAAIDAFRRSLARQPDDNVAAAGLYPLLRIACDWDAADELSSAIDSLNAAALAAGDPAPEPPLDNIHRRDDPAMNLAVARSWSCALAGEAKTAPALPAVPARDDELIRIGYLSWDFHDHATMHLMGGLFEAHDRASFQIHAYAYGPDDDSDERRTAETTADEFIDIRTFSDRDAAARIREDGIDILVDLKGYTRGHRLGICALRPAPIQITYLGFPGSTGADFFDYAITDETVTPADASEYFSENLIYMPNSYQINYDYSKSKKLCGIKSNFFNNDDIFIYCSFNNTLKFDRNIFEIWMSLLSNTPDSVLWLLANNELAQHNLRAAAMAAGVDPARLVFADMVARDKHLTRLSIADLALDTRLYNGHTTTSDALRAGVPVVTMIGRHFASRVSASLLEAIGIPELITADLGEYERRALALAQEPEALAALRAKIGTHRITKPLFNTTAFARSLEAAYKRIWTLRSMGERPQGFKIENSDQE